MRLLKFENSELSLTEDIVNNLPPYAILSHTWGRDQDEVTFRELTQSSGTTKAGYRKILFCAEQAERDGLRYCWVDTCCIDKSNNTELSEAINSMFRWYRNAAKCYVYLSDVPTDACGRVEPSSQSWQSAFRESRWFTRGWTLQELIAPLSVEFFDSDRNRLGDKKSLEVLLHEITKIAVPALRGTDLSAFTVTERLSWAKSRQTKKEEDEAYSLLGVFNVSMPLIYGEGKEKALDRLLNEVHQHGKKRHRDEVSEATFEARKRLMTSHNQPSSVLSPHQALHPEPLSYSEYPIHGIDASTKQLLVDQLYFSQIDERLTGLTAAQQGTCRWFLTKPEYLSWQDVTQQQDHGGFLWIKGNPGTGKSTLMKFLFEKAKVNTKDRSLQITLSFFFLARGKIEEKSTTGLYRSLLHQIFQKVEELKESLDWMTADGARAIQQNGWHEEALKQTLTHAIEKLGGRSLMLFVDALDECDTKQTTGMVCFFEELCDHAREAQVQLQICFSSRHYPTIILQQGVELTIEDEIGHTKDIQHYIKSKLKVGKTKPVETLQTNILEKSSSIFLWVVLVVDILNSEYRNGSALTKIRQRLKEIPPKLTDLFEMILTRDGENLERLQICLKWVLFATRPLKPPELYFAIQLGLNKDYSTCWDQEDIDLDHIKTFVRSSSKGLAEVTRNKSSEVQFIHESVREFLLRKYTDQWSGASGNFVGQSHEILKNCCMAQLNASIQDADLPDPLPQASKAAQLRETFSSKYPFLEYSVLNVLFHSNSAQQNSIEQGAFLTNFPLKKWAFINNALEKHDVRRYTQSVGMIYILAERNLADLIRIHPQNKCCFDVDVEHERYGPPIFAALAIGNYEAVQTLLDIQAAIRPEDPTLYQLCKQYSENKCNRAYFGRKFTFSRRKGITFHAAEQGGEIIFGFLCALSNFDLESKDVLGRTPLSWAAYNGHEAVVKLLIEQGAALEAQDKSGQTPLSWAVENGHEAVVKLLLEKGAALEAQDNADRTPLSWASEKGHKAVVKLLLEKGAALETQDKVYGRTPLCWAAERGDEAIVKLLLEKGTALETQDKVYGRTPLSWAAENGHEAVIKLLLEKGAALKAQDNTDRTPLSWASEKGHKAVIKLLLEKGAALETQDKVYGRTPLSWAAKNGHEAVVKLLLEKGATLETQDKVYGRTPLSWAVENGYEAVVKLLLEKGAALETQDKAYGRTPLCWAVERVDKAVVKLLLEKGSALETQDKVYGRTPLFWAVINRHKAIIKLLLEKGAALETQDNTYGRTPLCWAAERGDKAVVKLLLEKGAVLEARDSFGRTPLFWAVERGDEAVIKLLLEKGAALETQDKVYGRTPLCWAAERGDEAVIKLLLEKGAALETQDKVYGRTPLYWAAERGDKAVIKLLLEKGAALEAQDNTDRTPLSWASEKGHEAVVKLLLEKGAALETQDKVYGRTPLSWAVENGHEAIVKLLLEKGTVLETQDKVYGRTPLCWAAERGDEAVVKLLLEKGAALEARDSFGQTPLFWAVEKRHEAVIKLLLEKGATLEAQNSSA